MSTVNFTPEVLIGICLAWMVCGCLLALCLGYVLKGNRRQEPVAVRAVVLSQPRDDAPDGLFDTSDRAMAARFGARTRQLLREGRDPCHIARLAASYAFKVDPSLRLIDREAWTIDVAGHRHLTMRGLVAVAMGSRSQVIH